jgi:hypothetical protein
VRGARAADELTKVGDAGIVAIALGCRVVPHCAAGNCELERAGDVTDVHLSVRRRDDKATCTEVAACAKK